MLTQVKTRLTIELVPRTCWFSNVRSEVSLEDWRVLKSIVALQSGNICEVCGGVGPQWPIECHEIWEYDDARLIQKLAGLIGLCPDCHQVKHYGRAQITGHGKSALQHLMKVNQWSEEDATHYIQGCFELWFRRSQFDWKLDITYLDRHGVRYSGR